MYLKFSVINNGSLSLLNYFQKYENMFDMLLDRSNRIVYPELMICTDKNVIKIF